MTLENLSIAPSVIDDHDMLVLVEAVHVGPKSLVDDNVALRERETRLVEPLEKLEWDGQTVRRVNGANCKLLRILVDKQVSFVVRLPKGQRRGC